MLTRLLFFKIIELLYQNNGKLEYDLDFTFFNIRLLQIFCNSLRFGAFIVVWGKRLK